MVEVTDEMRDLVVNWRSKSPSPYFALEHTIQALIELHEANKPKPEPVGFISFKHGGWLVKPHEAERMNNIDAEFQPLYTTPPTREPLSEDDIWRICDESDKISSTLDFARAIEQAHGIGEKQ